MTYNARIPVWASVAAVAMSVVLAFGSTTPVLAADDLPVERRTLHGGAFHPRLFHVESGNEQLAKDYYSKLSAQMKFKEGDILNATVTDLLAYFGYANVAPKDLHRLGSDELMALGAPSDILATRFFAPKISGVSANPPTIPETGFGWRKLVRFKAKVGSAAANNGLELLYFLQNVFEKSPAGDPFDMDKHVAKFNQAMAVRKVGSGPYSGAKHPLYFFTFSELVAVDPKQPNIPLKIGGQFTDEGRLIFALKATFDEQARDPETNQRLKDYFVPDSCNNCHGDSTSQLKINYLDTDHWQDRVTPAYGLNDPKFSKEDFTGLAASPFGVLYDAGKDRTKPKFVAAFDVLRRLNAEIREQNKDVDPGADNFALKAVERWIELHSTETGHVPPYKRGFGNAPWNEASTGDRTLLYYLNRYCFRCHSSLHYHVFDREAVSERKLRIPKRVTNIDQQAFWMPQDRIFPGLTIAQGVATPTGDLKEFLDLVSQLP